MNNKGYILIDGILLLLVVSLFLSLFYPLLGSLLKVEEKVNEFESLYYEYERIIEYLMISNRAKDEIIYGEINFTRLIDDFKNKDLVKINISLENNYYEISKLNKNSKLWEIEIKGYNDEKEIKDKIYLLR